MLHKVRALASNPFMRQNAVFFVGSLLVGGFNYLYYPILGRMMEPEAYGEVQAVVALFMQLLIFFNVLSQVSVNVVANYTDEDRKQRIIFELEKLAFMVSLGLLIAGVAASFYIKSFFHFESVWPFIVLLLVVVSTVPLSFRGAFLRAHQRFGMASIANIIGAAGKVIFSAALVWLGFNTIGAIGGILIAQLLSFGYAAYKANQLGFMKPLGTHYFSKPNTTVIGPELKYAGFVFICSMSIMLLTSLDIFVAKHYFDPQTAGEYAGISTVARIIFFLTASIAQVLLPAVKLANLPAENRKLFLKSFLFLSATGGVAAIVLALFSRASVQILMGEDYLPYASLLPLLSLAMFLLSVVNLVVSYYIALRKYQILGIIVPGICMTVVLMWVSHDSVRDIVVNLIYGSFAMLGLSILWRGFHAIQNWRSSARPKTHFNSNPRV
jgi:O-antigen/teichoic acid export membrane protein